MNNGYVAFWNAKRLEVRASSSFLAQLFATQEFQKNSRRKVKSHEVTVVLAEKGDETVTHDPAGI